MKKKKSGIDLDAAVKKLLTRKKLITRNLILAAIISSAIIVCVPRYYTCEVMLAPEFDASATGGTLGSLAATFGVNIGSGSNSDAISPSLYPDLMESKEFLVTLFPIKVKTADGTLETDYYTYLTKHQKHPWWNSALRWITRSIKNLFGANKPQQASNLKDIDPFKLSELEYKTAEGISSRILCSIDRKSYVITIRVSDQDPLICASMADSVRMHLQQFITNYRTSKARVDVEFYTTLVQKSKEDYDKALKIYSQYADSHRDMILQTYISERDKLENDLQMKFGVYSAARQQLEGAKAKVQERTPAFTLLKNASVPIKPAGPKRVFFVLGMMFLVFLATALYITNKDKIRRLLKGAAAPKDGETAENAAEASIAPEYNKTEI